MMSFRSSGKKGFDLYTAPQETVVVNVGDNTGGAWNFITSVSVTVNTDITLAALALQVQSASGATGRLVDGESKDFPSNVSTYAEAKAHSSSFRFLTT